MIDIDYLAYLEGFLTENRKERFEKVLANRTNHFTIVVEDVMEHADKISDSVIVMVIRSSVLFINRNQTIKSTTRQSSERRE